MSQRRKWILIGAGLLLAALAYWMDQKHPFPPVVRNRATQS
jgi:hypothetical protein